MTAYFKDPKDGANYANLSRLSRSDMNAWITGIRKLDTASLQRSLRFNSIHQPSNIFGGGIQKKAGVLITFTATQWRAVSVSAFATTTGDPFTVSSGTTLPASPTITSFAFNAYGADVLVMANAGHAYIFPHTLTSIARYPFSVITTVSDVLWSDYSSQFVAVGSASGIGRIETSPDGQTWTNKNLNSTGGYGQLASDVTGQYILAHPTTQNVWVYSEDGGDTWVQITKSIGDDPTPIPTGIAYDNHRGIWVATFSSTNEPFKVWYTDVPTADWTPCYAEVDSSGLVGESVARLNRIITIGSHWLVVASSNNHSNLTLSSNGGTSWVAGASLAHTSSSQSFLRRAGDYLLLGKAGSSQTIQAISGSFYPE